MVQVQKTITKQPAKTPAEQIEAPPERVDTGKIDASTADILDELDEVLEEMGEDFALNFVQRGGE